MLTRMPFHSATISTIFNDYNSLLMLQSSRYYVNITNKITTFIGVMKSACRFGHSKEKWALVHLYIISNIGNTKKYLLKLSEDYKLSKCSIFKVQAFWKHCSVLKGCLRYKTITSQNVSYEAKVKNIFIS